MSNQKLIQLKMSGEDHYMLTSPVSAGAPITDRAKAALFAAVDYEAARAGRPFQASSDHDNSSKGDLSTLKDGGEQVDIIPSSSDSASSSSLPVPEGGARIEYSSLSIPAGDPNKIDSEVLASIRSFIPSDGDKVFTYLDYEAAQSSVLIHRQRAMYLLNQRYTIPQIKEMVENKTRKLVSNSSHRAAVYGIPKKKLELFLSDSVLTHRVTSYSSLLRELYSSKCVVQPIMVELVPPYIGQGGKDETTAPSAEETKQRRMKFLNATATYLQPLYTSPGFRAMIDAEKAKQPSQPAT